jgi:hypothetical protein
MTERNVRYAAPELRPINITDDEMDLLDVRPTFQSDTFSLGILLLQVCPYLCSSSVNHSTMFVSYSCFTDQMRIDREGCHTITSATIHVPVTFRC